MLSNTTRHRYLSPAAQQTLSSWAQFLHCIYTVSMINVAAHKCSSGCRSACAASATLPNKQPRVKTWVFIKLGASCTINLVVGTCCCKARNASYPAEQVCRSILLFASQPATEQTRIQLPCPPTLYTLQPVAGACMQYSYHRCPPQGKLSHWLAHC